MKYHLLVWTPGINPPAVSEYDSELELAEELKSLCARAYEPMLQKAKVYIFAGQRMYLSGNPRQLSRPDGTTIPVGPVFDMADDGCGLSHPSV